MEVQPAGGSTTTGLQDLILNTEVLTEHLQEFAAAVAQRLSQEGKHVWCAVTLVRHRKPVTAISSGPQAAASDATQNRFPHGPCLTAIQEHTVVRVDEIRSDSRWADYHAVAADQRVRFVLGVPSELGDEAQAGLNFYSNRPQAFTPETVENARHEVAMGSRTTIDLAVGSILGRNRCSQDRAFEILRAASSNCNVKLREVATELVETVGKGPATTHSDA